MLRGVAVAVSAVLVGAWAVGLAEFGDTSSSTEDVTTPVSPDGSPVPDSQHSTVPEKAKPRRTREAGPSREALTEPSPDTTDEQADDAPGTPDPPGTSEKPSNSSPPPQAPSNPPSQPADDCTDLGVVADCALDPITGRP